MATASEQIQILLAQLAAQSASHGVPSSYKGYQSTFKPVNRAMPKTIKQWDLLPNTVFKSEKPKAKKPSGLKPDLLGILNGTIGQSGGFATSYLHNILKEVNGSTKPLWQDVVGGIA